MINRCYLEITNICNLDCVFCPKHHRPFHSLSMQEFDTLTTRLQGEVRFLYMHLMGEPFMHRLLPDFLRMAREKGFIPILTTNGTLLHRPEALQVLAAGPYKVQISLHSQEGNGVTDYEQYIDGVMRFALAGAAQGVISVLRFWNVGGLNQENEHLLSLIRRYIPEPWMANRNGFKLAENIYLEYDRVFSWPDRDKPTEYAPDIFCYALRNQVGVLVDGTVVPCCLDHDGDLALGNLYDTPLSTILDTPRAHAIYDGFTRHEAVEPMCRRCGYAAFSPAHQPHNLKP